LPQRQRQQENVMKGFTPVEPDIAARDRKRERERKRDKEREREKEREHVVRKTERERGACGE
jgi:hypothetical protein